MKLYVEMQNFGMVGFQGSIISRVVEIELTPEQESMLVPRFTHSSGNDKYYEVIRPISIEETNHEH